ncbi:hypothetical protein VTN49DRAFT_690 [Thermomyces lanuginosus]|uniref:uncharacterized protein n=1 Tax=Thermomyces lanuginosus TaxID=5541 RepID=UPI003743B93C
MAAASGHDFEPRVPSVFCEQRAIRDQLDTETRRLQDETVLSCLPYLRGTDKTVRDCLNAHGVAWLQRDHHIEYLYDSLEDYPGSFVSFDSSRPWLSYWGLAGLALLGEDVTKYRHRVIANFTPMQNSGGGFGGGHGQMSHLACSFAAVLSIALVGGADAYELVDRRAMWSWLGELKQPDGGFQMVVGGEEDVRGAYCAMVIISLLDLPLDLPPESNARQSGLRTFLDGLPEYLARCQSYEGGISGQPGGEAHGAYAFCALACLCIIGKPNEIIPRYMDVPLLLSWLSARQYAPEGGFSGRTNKLVDACYSHWVGDCWPLVQSALYYTAENESVPALENDLFSREGLARYILNCCQNKTGGLRDKPGKRPDSYHTCYALAGLSMLQHHHYRVEASSPVKGVFASAFSWTSAPFRSDANVFDEEDRLVPLHPLYTIPHQKAVDIRRWCEEHPI